jgi:hypothetical protein
LTHNFLSTLSLSNYSGDVAAASSWWGAGGEQAGKEKALLLTQRKQNSSLEVQYVLEINRGHGVRGPGSRVQVGNETGNKFSGKIPGLVGGFIRYDNIIFAIRRLNKNKFNQIL